MPAGEADLFEHAPAAFIVFDAHGVILEANRAFFALVGRSPEGGECNLTEVMTAAGRIYLESHVRPHLELNGHIDEVALEVVRADGTRVPVLMNANMWHPDAGGPGLIRAVLFQALERRRYEQELLTATRAAEEAERRATDLSRTLQQTLIPPSPPHIPGFDITGAYRPAGDGGVVGGDFYDIFNVADRTWCVVLGDVAGKGIPAATVTAFIRHTVRALAMWISDPAELLRELDEVMQRQQVERYCTLAFLRLEQKAQGWVLCGSLGGHPLPLLGRSDGSVEELGIPGSLVGILDEVSFESFEHTLADDEFVLLFTDGVTEARRGGALFGEEGLVSTVADHASAPAGITAAVVDAALDYQDGTASDDIAVLTLRPAAPAEGGQRQGGQ